ncbi:MAG: hypothetical protein AAF404_15735, partial [Pseudomonadota bacterium]
HGSRSTPPAITGVVSGSMTAGATGGVTFTTGAGCCGTLAQPDNNSKTITAATSGCVLGGIVPQ